MKPVNLHRAIRLFEEEWKITDIAGKLKVSKQAVSGMLREHYASCDPEIMIDHVHTKICKVCECEETTVINRVPLRKLKQLRLKPFHTVQKYICPMCEQLNLYRCTSCGSTGYLDGGEFLRTPVNEENRRGRCRACNRMNVGVWRKKNRERFREIYGKYKNNLKAKRREKKLCIECGKPNRTPELAMCPACRERYKGYKRKSRLSRQG